MEECLSTQTTTLCGISQPCHVSHIAGRKKLASWMRLTLSSPPFSVILLN